MAFPGLVGSRGAESETASVSLSGSLFPRSKRSFVSLSM